MRLGHLGFAFGGKQPFCELAHESGFGHGLSVDAGSALHSGDCGFEAEDFHFDAQLIARHHRLAELGFFDGGEKHDAAASVRRDIGDEDTADLRHGLDDENSGHDGESGKMSGELRLIERDVLDPDDGVASHFDNTIDHQHRVPMWQNRADFLGFEGGHGESYYNNLMDAYLRYATEKQAEIIALIEDMVNSESPSDSPEHVNRFLDVLIDRTSDIATAKRIRPVGYGDHLRLEFQLPGDEKQGQVLGVGHSDTVWPAGTLERMPFRRGDGRLWGPGVLDMKAGLAFFIYAARTLRDLDVPVGRKVVLWIVSDEEVGSESSRALTEAEAKSSDFVMVVEPGTGLSGKIKTARKGVGVYTIFIEGKASHAGVDFSNGASAIIEAARQIQTIAGFTDLARGITVNPGLVAGGTRTNVIAADARIEVDVRVETLSDADVLDGKFQALRPVDKQCAVRVEGGLNRPPMERTPAIAQLFEKAKRIGAELGRELEESSTGGGSDGNFTAALGVPTLDGLGAVGEGAHAVNESILVDRIADRTALLAKLMSAR